MLSMWFPQGGVSDEVSLTAYIVAALLELNGGSTVSQTALGSTFSPFSASTSSWFHSQTSLVRHLEKVRVFTGTLGVIVSVSCPSRWEGCCQREEGLMVPLCLVPLPQDPVVQKGLGCLKDAVVKGFDNLYTTALMSYTFSLAGDQETRSKLISILDLKAKKEGKRAATERQLFFLM